MDNLLEMFYLDWLTEKEINRESMAGLCHKVMEWLKGKSNHIAVFQNL